MPIIDELGTWEDLGIVDPLADDWQFLPNFPKKNFATFKVFFIGDFDLLRKWQVSCWIRAAYFSGSQYFFDRKWLRLYPKDEPEIIYYPYPSDIIKEPLPQRQFQAKRRLRFFRNQENLKDKTPPLGIQIQEKTDSRVVYPGELYPAVIEEEA